MRTARTLAWLTVFAFSCCGSDPNGGTPESLDPDAREPFGTPSTAIGLNLSSVSYYATQEPFADVFRNRDAWVSTDGDTWNTDRMDDIPTDSGGYPVSLPIDGQMVQAGVFLPFKGDSFEISWQGTGQLSLQGPDLQITQRAAHSLSFSVQRSFTDSVFLRIERSDASDHVRDIRVQADAPYDTGFSAILSGFHVLRFMDWGGTNDSPIEHWSDRTTEAEGQGSTKGVAIETMVDTANNAHADLWFNVPHRADDDYIERAAKLLKERLTPGLKIYVEYSNENWNGIFSQVEWEQERGVALGLDRIGVYSGESEAGAYWAGLKYSIRRAAVVHDTFRRVLGASRVVAVVAGQSAASDVNEKLLSFYEDERINPLGGHPDALAVAPYFGQTYGDPEEAAELTVDDILDQTEASIASTIGETTQQNRAIADAHAVKLIAYEAGQHLLAVGDLAADEDFVQRLFAANRKPRMGELYRLADEVWRANGGELAVYFNSCQPPTKYGTWGALEYQGQPASEAPKWAALLELTKTFAR